MSVTNSKSFDLSSITKNSITKSITSVLLIIFVSVLVVALAYFALTTLSEPSSPLEECETVKDDKENVNFWFSLVGICSAVAAAIAGFAVWHGNQEAPPPFKVRGCYYSGAKLECREYPLQSDTAEDLATVLNDNYFTPNPVRPVLFCRQGNILNFIFQFGDWSDSMDQDLANVPNCDKAQVDEFAKAVIVPLHKVADRLKPLKDMLNVKDNKYRLVACHKINGLFTCVNVKLATNDRNGLVAALKQYANADQSKTLTSTNNRCRINNTIYWELAVGPWKDEEQTYVNNIDECGGNFIEKLLRFYEVDVTP